MPNKPSRTTFQQRLNEMVDSLRNDIVTGKWCVGQFLPSITQLSKTYQLSINSVQKGLDRLEAESLIERLPRVGIRVMDSAKQEPVTLSLGYYPSLLKDIELAAIIEQFQADCPHIRIQLVPLQYASFNDITQFYLSSQLVDVITINHIHFLNFKHEHADLSELLEPIAAQSGIQPYIADTFTQDRSHFAQPVAFSPVVLCYNKQIIQELGKPLPSFDWTWHDFMGYLDDLEMNSDFGMSFYFYPANYNRWPIFLLQSAVPYLQEKNVLLQLDHPSVIDGIQACYDLIHRNKRRMLLLSDDDFNVEEMFAQQKISIMMTTYFNLNKLRNENDLPFELAPLPYVHTPKTMLATIGLAVNARSNYKEAAKTFVDYVVSYKSQLLIRKHTYSIPALQAAAEWEGEESIYRPESFHIYQKLTDTFAHLDDLNLNVREKEALLNVMKMYWTDMISKEEVASHLSEIGLPSNMIFNH